MSLRWMMLLTAGYGLVGIGMRSANAGDAAASSEHTPAATVSSGTFAAKREAPSAKQLRDAVAESVRRAAAAKGNDRAATVKALLDVYFSLGSDVLLPAKERLRLGVQVRARLQRFATQLHYETAHNINPRVGNGPRATARESQIGASGGPAVEGLDSLFEVIQTTIARPDDWIALQQAGNGPVVAEGGFGVAVGGGAANGRGGAFGGNGELEKAADANGADLVDLIQKTVDPASWDVNGGVGSIIYFNNLRVLVVRQTGDGQEDVGGVLGGLRKH